MAVRDERSGVEWSGRHGGICTRFKEWSISNFCCNLPRNITSHSTMNCVFYSLLRWKMIILPPLSSSLTHSSLKSWENVRFGLGSKMVKTRRSMRAKMQKHSRKTIGTNEPAQGNAAEVHASQATMHVRGVQLRLKSSRHPLYIYYARSHVAQSFRLPLHQHRWVNLYGNVFTSSSSSLDKRQCYESKISTGAKFKTRRVPEAGSTVNLQYMYGEFANSGVLAQETR